MATKSPVYCPVCHENMAPAEDLEHHLVAAHRPRELARVIVSEWETSELDE